MTMKVENTKYTVLVLCTGNSARSIMVEALFNTIAGQYFQAHSAGSRPTGKVNPFALEQISKLSMPKDFTPRSKSWDEFGRDDAPQFDFVITVCGNAAQEICPCFKGKPNHIHWGQPDPAAVEGGDDAKRLAFSNCFEIFKNQITQLVLRLEQTSHKNNRAIEPIWVESCQVGCDATVSD